MSKRGDKTSKITLEQAVNGHLLYVEANFTQSAWRDYNNSHQHMLRVMGGDLIFNEIDVTDLERYLVHMKNEPLSEMTRGRGRRGGARKPESIARLHTALRSLWKWATERGFCESNVAKLVPRPKSPSVPVVPLDESLLPRLLEATRECSPWKGTGTTRSRATAERDRAILVLLLEGMLRASELLNLKREDVAFTKNGRTKVRVNLGKGGKSREVFLGRSATRILEIYNTVRPEVVGDWFIYSGGQKLRRKMSNSALYGIIKKLGEKIGVKIHPHLLRTTGACLSVNNGIEAFHLKELMGHSQLNNTMRYVRAAKLDLEGAVAGASVFDNLNK